MESDNKTRHMKDKNKITKENNDTIKKDDQNQLEVIKDQLNVLLDDNDANFLAGFDIVDDDDWGDKDKSTDKTPHKRNKNEPYKSVSKSQVKASDAGRHVNRSTINVTSKSVISKRSTDSRDNDKKPDGSVTRKNLKDRDVECHKKKDEDNKKTSKDRARSSVTSSSVSSNRKRTSSSPKQGEGAKKVSSQQKGSPHSSSRRDKDKAQTSSKEGGSAKLVSPQRKESSHSSSKCDKSVRDSKSDSKSKLSQTRKVDEERHKKVKESEKRRSVERSSLNIKQNRNKSDQSGDKAVGKRSNVENVSDRKGESNKTHRDVERHKDTHEREESKRKHHNVRDTVRRLSVSPKRKRRSRSSIRDRSTEKNSSRPREYQSRNSLNRTGIAGRDRSMGTNSSRLKQNHARGTSPLAKMTIRRRPTRSPVSSFKSRIPYSRRQYSPSASRVSPLRKNISIAEQLHGRRRRPAGPPKSLRHESESLLQEIIHKLNDTRSVRLQPVMMVPVPQMSEPHSQQNLLYLPPFVKSTSNVTIPAGAPAISLRPDRVVATTALNPYRHEEAYQSQNQPFFSSSSSTSFHQGSPIPNCRGFSSQRLQTVSNQSLASVPGKIDSSGSNFPRDQSLDSRSSGIPKQVSGTGNQEKLLIRSTKVYGHYLGLSNRSGAPDMGDNASSHRSSSTLSDLRSVKRVSEYSPIPTGAVSAVRGDNLFGRSSTTLRHDASTRNRMINCSRCGAGGVATRDCRCGIPVSSPARMGRKLSRN